MTRKYSMPPVADGHCTILILGSLPGERSLAMQQYYAHPQNQFWKLICVLLDEPLPTDCTQRLNMLLRHGIALWDVVAQATREGSLDSSILAPLPNDFDAFFADHPHICKIVLNGGKAAQLYHRHFKHLAIPTVQVPSSSPAHASLSFDQKLVLWRKALATT